MEVIEPRLKEGKNVLVVTHGNVMRGLIAYLASLGEEEMLTLEVGSLSDFGRDIPKSLVGVTLVSAEDLFQFRFQWQVPNLLLSW